jgi:hypothetical protein
MSFPFLRAWVAERITFLVCMPKFHISGTGSTWNSARKAMTKGFTQQTTEGLKTKTVLKQSTKNVIQLYFYGFLGRITYTSIVNFF